MKSKYLLLLVLLTTSCKSQHNTLFEIDPGNWKENKITLADIADGITYIPLDNPYPIVARIAQITDNSIFLRTSDGVLAFNRDGEMARKIGNIGRGPGEYFGAGEFAVDENTETVYVKDMHFIIKVYNRNGDYQRSINLPKSEDGYDFAEVDFYNSYLFVSEFINMGHGNYNWIIIDTLGNIIETKKNSVPTFQSNQGFGGGTYKFENKIHYWNFYNDTIFSVLPDLSYKAAFLFSQGEHRWPRSNTNTDQVFSQYMFPASLFETNRFFVFSYNYNEKSAIMLFDKRSKEIFLTYLDHYMSGIYNDLDGGIMFHPRQNSYFVENSREYLAGLIEPLKLKVHVASDEFRNATPKYPEKKQELEKLANSLKETDNPVLMMVRLKK